VKEVFSGKDEAERKERFERGRVCNGWLGKRNQMILVLFFFPLA